MSFNLEALVAACKGALADDKPQEKITDIIRRAVGDPESVKAALGQEETAGIQRLYVSAELTLINVVWAPKMTLPAHNHNVWAVIGVYAGREDNIFWRKQGDDLEGRVEAAGAKSIAAGEVVSLGKKLIHSVTNPTASYTRAIHVYGGDFFEIERSEWDPLSLTEGPHSIERTLELFKAENSIIRQI